jgi:hypothetical protein
MTVVQPLTLRRHIKHTIVNGNQNSIIENRCFHRGK